MELLISDFVLMKILSKCDEFLLNGIFCHKCFFEFFFKKGARNFLWGRPSSHLSLLAIILRIPWNNVTSQVEIYLGMLATLAPSRNWKNTLLLLMWENRFAHKHSNFNPIMSNFHSFYVDHLILMWNNNTMYTIRYFGKMT